MSRYLNVGADDYRGGSGPLHVSRGPMTNPLFNAFIEAGQQAGYPYTEDMNGYQQEGFGPMDMTIYKGKRWSAAQGYLRPALKRKNLKTITKALCYKILFEGTKAVGVEFVKDNQIRRAKANKEVILSGGAINSPQLLMLSGIGNAEELGKLTIPVIANLSGVGQNLQDHLEMYVQHVSFENFLTISSQVMELVVTISALFATTKNSFQLRSCFSATPTQKKNMHHE